METTGMEAKGRALQRGPSRTPRPSPVQALQGLEQGQHLTGWKRKYPLGPTGWSSHSSLVSRMRNSQQTCLTSLMVTQTCSSGSPTFKTLDIIPPVPF